MKQLLQLSWLIVLGYLFSCTPNNVTVDNSIGAYFDSAKVTGSFGLYDNGQNNFLVYNLPRFKDSAYLPASTFKIVNSLIGLETGAISGKDMVIPWDGKVHIFPGGDTAKDWNKDLTMEEAFKVSALPYYQEVARRIGKDTMQLWLDSLGYGRRYGRPVIQHVDSFWIDNSVKVTADEQMGLVKKLYFNQLPFHKKSTQDVVKEVMIREKNANYTLAYKTGLGFRENGRSLGWIVGWIEENKHPYFFVLNVEGDHDAPMIEIRKKLLMSILTNRGFMQGKK
ncbi:class D beta-lactamase [Filimonas effusa]|uniref:Beta-lactamase n=1 Tax=Filimonas effusa TaxID=2508721 RepID=A0A4Q1D6Z5_9BACT|nr:class D beta-lactamase [Filimonas effusa]RXK83447.1 class D beta-lactamase [Filimonas effusa]